VTLADLPIAFLRAMALFFGLIWGSFLNVVIYRVPRDMSVSRPASHCPACGTPIAWYRNLPVLSWLFMRGRAACCGVKISARYPLVELIGGLLSLAVLERLVLPMGPGTPLLHVAAIYLAHFALVLALIAAAFIDLEFMIVPDTITFGGTILGLATFSLRGMDIVDAALGALVGFVMVWLPFVVIYPRLRGRVGMGLGDAKLLMLAGAWLGWSGTVMVLGLGAVQGTLAYVVLRLTGRELEEPEAVRREREEIAAELAELPPEERAEREAELAADPLANEPSEGWGQARIAFGPFLILAILEVLLLGRDQVLQWIAGF
jgi:leader peptidase (prepilin peptidase)/N-methyltransferase